MKPNRKPASPEAKFILDLMLKRNPDATIYALAQKTGIDKGTLHNMFYTSKSPFKQGQYLLMICSELGILPESVFSQKNVSYDRDKELNYWKDRAFQAEGKLKQINPFLKKVSGELLDFNGKFGVKL